MSRAYDLEPEPDRPRLPERFVRTATSEEAVEQLATDLFIHIQNCVRAFGDCHLALSGGSTIERVCHVLMLDPQFRPLPWKRVQVWSAVDTVGPWPTSRMLRELLVEHADVPAAQCHLPRDAVSAVAYSDRLREQLGWRERGHDRIDAVVLDTDAMAVVESMTGSLAPAENGRARATPLVREVSTADGAALAFDPGVVRASRLVSVGAYGPDAQHAVGLERDRAESDRLIMHGGAVRWYVDHASWPSEGTTA